MLLTRVQPTLKPSYKAQAVRKVWEKFPSEVQAGFRAGSESKGKFHEMAWDDFRDAIQGALRDGINSGARHLKVRINNRTTITPVAKEIRPPTPPKRNRSPELSPPSDQTKDPLDLDLDELAAAFKEMKIQQQKAQLGFIEKIEELRQMGTQVTDHQVEELRTFVLQRGNRRFQGQDRRVGFKHHVRPSGCYYCGSKDHFLVSCRSAAEDFVNGLDHKIELQWVLGDERKQPRGDQEFVQIHPIDANQAQEQGKMRYRTLLVSLGSYLFRKLPF